jgi:transposase-like protein
LKEEGTLHNRTQLRQCKYLNNLIEQVHRFIKRRVNAGLGLFVSLLQLGLAFVSAVKPNSRKDTKIPKLAQ